MTKSDVSREMVEYFTDHSWCYFVLTMGAGKTKGSLDCIVAKHGYRRKGLICVHSVPARDKIWPAEIDKFHPQLKEAIERGFVTFIHKDQICNLKPDWYDWVIWDEVHFAKREHLQWIKLQQIEDLIIMTGTEPSDAYMNRNLRRMVDGNVMKITVEEGIDEGLINDYRVKMIGVEMDATKSAEYKEISARLTKARHVNPDWLASVQNERARWIYASVDKFRVMKELNELLREKRRLLFMPNKEMCNQISDYVYYSGSHIKDRHFNMFAKGKVAELATVRMIKAGTNIFNFDHILCQQFNSKYENFMQTLGRLFRLAPTDTGWVYATFLKDTQDYAWLDKASGQVPPHKKRYYDLSRYSLEEIIKDTF